jgi:hypothetical protein
MLFFKFVLTGHELEIELINIFRFSDNFTRLFSFLAVLNHIGIFWPNKELDEKLIKELNLVKKDES